MSQCTSITSDGFVVASNESPDTCTGYHLVSHTEYQLMVESVEINPVEMLTVFTVTFGWVVLLAGLSYHVKTAKGLISKA